MSEQEQDSTNQFGRDSQYWVGFVSAIMFVVAVALGLRLARWLQNNGLDAVVEVLTKPMFSPLEALGVLLVLLVLAVAATIPVWGPRP